MAVAASRLLGEEAAAAGRGDHAHVPAFGVGQLHSAAGVAGRRGAADDEIQHAAALLPGLAASGDGAGPLGQGAQFAT